MVARVDDVIINEDIGKSILIKTLLFSLTL